ncbi:MAG: nucleotidyltransferase family protein [Conexivisphaerales archaeon]
MKEVVGVVLCGGLGSRLRPLTYYFQKVMLPIGSAQRPILEYILHSLRMAEIRNALLLANYKFEQIRNYFGDGSTVDMELTYIMDDPSYRGSGGALLNAWKKGKINDDATILIYYGDILTKLDLRKMLQQHWNDSSVATLAVAKGFRVPVGVAKMDGKKISSFEEKPEIDINVGVGIMALESKALAMLEEIYNIKHGDSIDIMGDLLTTLIKKGENVEGFVFDDFWLDVGSIEAYEKVDPKKFDDMFSGLIEERVRATSSNNNSSRTFRRKRQRAD